MEGPVDGMYPGMWRININELAFNRPPGPMNILIVYVVPLDSVRVVTGQ
jgi:hypothetical protein